MGDTNKKQKTRITATTGRVRVVKNKALTTPKSNDTKSTNSTRMTTSTNVNKSIDKKITVSKTPQQSKDKVNDKDNTKSKAKFKDTSINKNNPTSKKVDKTNDIDDIDVDDSEEQIKKTTVNHNKFAKSIKSSKLISKKTKKDEIDFEDSGGGETSDDDYDVDIKQLKNVVKKTQSNKNKKVVKDGSDDFIIESKTKEELYKIGGNHEYLKNYRITKTGKIWSTTNKKFLKTKFKNGYHRINTKDRDKDRSNAIHRLVGETFIPNPDNKPYINHINEIKTDNRVENLEWVTQKENTERHNKVTSHARQVKQIDIKTGDTLAIFNMIKDAAKAVGRTPRAINLVLGGTNKTAGGYYWEYIDTSNYKEDIDINDLMNNPGVKRIDGYDNYYVYRDGRIYNSINKKFLKPVKNDDGRVYVTLCKKGQRNQNPYIHRIVADHFLVDKSFPNANVIHINNNLEDNSVENLKWSNIRQIHTKSTKSIIDEENERKAELEDLSTDDSDEESKNDSSNDDKPVDKKDTKSKFKFSKSLPKKNDDSTTMLSAKKSVKAKSKINKKSPNKQKKTKKQNEVTRTVKVTKTKPKTNNIKTVVRVKNN